MEAEPDPVAAEVPDDPAPVVADGEDDEPPEALEGEVPALAAA